MKILLGLLLGFAIGAMCRLFNIPVPAPPVIEGALLVVAMTLGYSLVDKRLARKATTESMCGGPSGKRPTQHKESDHD